jgi:hypothetical protein
LVDGPLAQGSLERIQCLQDPGSKGRVIKRCLFLNQIPTKDQGVGLVFHDLADQSVQFALAGGPAQVEIGEEEDGQALKVWASRQTEFPDSYPAGLQ